jgi:serine protease Do
MNRPRSLSLSIALALAGSLAVLGSACAQNPPPTATATNPTAAPAAPLVVGLPDFTGLVERVAPAVVNVEARLGARSQPTDDDGGGGDDGMPDIFRRFFGPGMPMPQMPRPQQGPRGMALGSGFIISPDGYVLTNAHVVDGADQVKVKLSDRREFKAKVVGTDPQSDVALLKIDAHGLPTVALGDSNQLKPGQWVVAIGSPFGLDHSVTAGVVSAVGRSNPYADQRYVPFIQTDVAINRGNSGGPLLNTRGQVVGINSQIFSNSGGYMGVSFAIPIDTAMGAVKQLKATGKVERGQLGVTVQGISADAAKSLGMSDTRGALVNGVLDGSPAARAGIASGDVIRRFDGEVIEDAADLPPLVGALAPGSRADVTVLRNGREMALHVTLTRLGDTQANAADDEGTPDKQPATPKAGNRYGLVLQDLGGDDRQQLGLKAGEGVGITALKSQSATDAGLQPGDVVLAVGRTKVGSVAALERALAAVPVGQPALLLVRRGNATVFMPVSPDKAAARQ